MLTLSGYSSPKRVGSLPAADGLSPMNGPVRRTSSRIRRGSLSGTALQRAETRLGRAASRPFPARLSRRLMPWAVSGLLLLLLLVSLWGVGGAEGAEIAPARPGEDTVTVTAGDTLWSIASAHGIADDTREGVYRLQKRNGLSSPSIEPGDTLIIPASR